MNRIDQNLEKVKNHGSSYGRGFTRRSEEFGMTEPCGGGPARMEAKE